MGCDIHMIAQKRMPDGEWEDAFPISLWRNYTLFAILAGVRNYQDIEPIAEPRGLPLDMKYIPRYTESYSEKDIKWNLGDHSYSWLALSELLDFDWTQKFSLEQCVPLVDYWEWKYFRDKFPKSYCSATSSTCISEEEAQRIIEESEEIRNWEDRKNWLQRKNVYVDAKWKVSYAYCAEEFWCEVIPRLLRLGRPSDVRIVFGFDS